MTPRVLAVVKALEPKVLWIGVWMIHHAKNVRPVHEGSKAGRHPVSSASTLLLVMALRFRVLRPEDRISFRFHAGSGLHAIRHLPGNQSTENPEDFREFGGAQSCPGRNRDGDDVDVSTGSVVRERAPGHRQRTGGAVADDRTWLRGNTGGPVRLRLSTHSLEQPGVRDGSEFFRGVIDGSGRWQEPDPGCDLVIAYRGSVETEAIAALWMIGRDRLDLAVLAITLADRPSAVGAGMGR